ncbi:hypothetical protein M426DRAFT_28090 [Hypoxylon sp. CI-4A]|nr:hypothetical protein M426DRAFT_28090 [Hypoxylon sp. CI-4A]
MNWTEGNLSRHSKGRRRNELLARQKQHFAKVRNNLPQGNKKQSPISISFLDAHNLRGSVPRNESSNRRSQPQPPPPSSPLLVEKRKRNRELSPNLETQLSVHQKRRRLLNKTDWVGLSLQQPIDIAFPGQLYASRGSRWSRAESPRGYAVRKQHEPVRTSRLEPTEGAQEKPLRIEIGSQVIYPSISTASQSNGKRYSIAQPLAGSPHRRSNTISSPAPSHARHLYVTSKDPSKISKHDRYSLERKHTDAYLKVPRELSLSDETESMHTAYRSSVLHAPIPRRGGAWKGFPWSPAGSEGQGSMKVEIGRPSSPVPSFHEADQKFWTNLFSTTSNQPPTDTSSLTEISSQIIQVGLSPSHIQEGFLGYKVPSEPETSTSQLQDKQGTDKQGTQVPVLEEVHQTPQIKSPHRQAKTETRPQPADNESVWMKFAFDDDSGEIEANAFAEAAHQAAVELLPSDTSASSLCVTRASVAENSEFTAINEKEFDGSESYETFNESHVETHGTAASESAVSNLATAGSTTTVESGSRFRFAQPRTFVGKLANSNITASKGPPTTSHRGGKRRGRPKKKAVDGRPNIRGLPDFDEDPIEE